jgi:nitrate reductase molybdenum cofactor assembly chaperone NarJ/NarW
MDYLLFAESFRYPAPGRLEILERGLDSLKGDAQPGYAAFVQGIRLLTLPEWEELYTRTWDLNPTSAPYIGYQIWGENYQRGNFMAAVNRVILEKQVDADGELPDHLIPVLRYLADDPAPLPELLEIFPAAIERIHNALQKAEPENPFTRLVESLLAYYKGRETAKNKKK